MSVLILGLLVFLGVHSTGIFAPAWRDRMAARLGEIPWKGLYSAASLVGLVLIVWGYGLARQDPVAIYAPPVWLRHLALLLMVPVFPLLLATYLPGRIQSTVKHPMLSAVKLWAFTHLLVNGNLADLILFGSFLACFRLLQQVLHPGNPACLFLYRYYRCGLQVHENRQGRLDHCLRTLHRPCPCHKGDISHRYRINGPCSAPRAPARL